MRPERLILAMGLSLAALSACAQSQQAACSALAEWSGSDDVRIDEARFYADRAIDGPGGSGALPPHCHVAGSFEHRTGVDGREYAIRFAINLPADWGGRFLFQGGGGLNGTVREPVGYQATGERTALARGFAVVSTDTGHQGAAFDGSFMVDQQAVLNFQFQANEKVVELTRPIVERYYGTAPHHSYFVGCSTGGREGMIMAQRFPEIFDGIVSGAPAMRTGLSNLALRWINVELAKAERTDPRDPFSESEEQLIMSALMKACDSLDGQPDGLIFNQAACSFDPAELACSAMPSGQQCLADDKAKALARAMAGPVNSAGMAVYVPYPYDSGIDDMANLPGLLIGGGRPPVGGSGVGVARLDVDEQTMAALATDQYMGSTATQYNVSSYVAKGGKHIFYHGAADPWFSANDTRRYFERMGEANASIRPTDEYGRLYLVPGMAHCSGGEQTVDRFDLLTPLVEWVENGIAPGTITATGASMPGQSRPLCPWPSYAHFLGGDAADAGNYECRVP